MISLFWLAPALSSILSPSAADPPASDEIRYADPPPRDAAAIPWAEPPPEAAPPQYADPDPDPDPATFIPIAEVGSIPTPPHAAIERDNPLSTLRRDPPQQDLVSPQRFLVELKLGPYLPDVDHRFPGIEGPYAQIFGETDDTGVADGAPKNHVMTVIGVEWQFLHYAGPLSVGASVGLFRDKADALFAQPLASDGRVRNSNARDASHSTRRADSEPAAEVATGGWRSKADQTRFRLIPLTTSLAYRFELLADAYRLPLVPYAKFGLTYGIWRTTDGNGDLSEDDRSDKSDRTGRGGSWGWRANLGTMLRLDFLERSAARELDRSAGINHTYLFGEWVFSRIDGFGDLQRMNVGAGNNYTWMAGLAMEF
ncbi:MAG: MXAN_2562 family outer membrane beta-barrel protein [Nannocystaceae bacterium]